MDPDGLGRNTPSAFGVPKERRNILWSKLAVSGWQHRKLYFLVKTAPTIPGPLKRLASSTL